MTKTVFSLIATILLLLQVFTPTLSFSSLDTLTALVIGNGSYKSSPLKNPVNDAIDIAAALKKLGFDVILITNADRRTMERSIRSFGRKLHSGGTGLFYYAGHGIQVEGTNYLIPTRAVIESEADVQYEAVDAGRVFSQMEAAANGLNIIVLDACRDNPFSRGFRSGNRGLAKMDAPIGSFLAYATAPGSVAADGTGRNGLYTSRLLKYIMTPGLEIEKLFKNVRMEVAKSSSYKQVPWVSSSLIGEFCFNKNAVMRENESSTVGTNMLDTVPEPSAVTLRVDKARIVDFDANFFLYENGVIFDKNTNLEWIAGPDTDTLFLAAKGWLENLNYVNNGNWKLPTRGELKTLYKKGTGVCNMTHFLNTTGQWVWSGDSIGSASAWGFNFALGKVVFPGETAKKDGRCFAVRYRN